MKAEKITRCFYYYYLGYLVFKSKSKRAVSVEEIKNLNVLVRYRGIGDKLTENDSRDMHYDCECGVTGFFLGGGDGGKPVLVQ